MPEQLSMDFTTSTLIPPCEEKESVIYDPLDFQLADLMLALNTASDNKSTVCKTLKNCTLKISKHTQEGQIFIACNETQQNNLLKTKVVGKSGDYKPLILDDGFLYLNRYFTYQQNLAKQIQARIELPNRVKQTGKNQQWQNERLDYYFKKDTQEGKTNWQQLSAEYALNESFLILSGGPGTGKTTTISRILALLIEQHLVFSNDNSKPLQILLAAPTGKASIRMLDSLRDSQQTMGLSVQIKEQMPTQASTLHKLLGYQPNKVLFKHNYNHPLNADVILVDEASMIDIALMSKLVDAVPEHAKLILIGDKDQLSSVETGSVFSDICEWLKGSNSLITLQKNWRFSKDSGIGQLAISVNQGDSNTVLGYLKNKENPACNIIDPQLLDHNKIPIALISPWGNYLKVLNNPDSSVCNIFKAFNQYRVLCALRRGLNGSTIMSNRIETALTNQGQLPKQQTWYHGRPIMVTQNSYSKGLFNGDMGITLIKNGETKVYFPADEDSESFKSYSPVRLPAYETTWAMTIHKSQGSEFNQVTLILPHEVMPLLTRQLIYTGITRAKEKINIIANEVVIKAGVQCEMVRATNIYRCLSR